MDTQMPIKIIIIVALGAIAVALILPTRGTRSSAIRRLLLLLFFFCALLAVIFPNVLSLIAEFLGVGRGTDLLLYGFIVVLLAHMLSSSRKQRALEKEITLLARAEAIQSAQVPTKKESDSSS